MYRRHTIKAMNYADSSNIKEINDFILFPLSKGIMHHGGVGTMTSALKSGKPQLIMPFSVDQPFWANRLYKLGYAIKPVYEKNLTVEDLINYF